MNKARKFFHILGLILASLTFLSSKASFSHCQVPCGIYDDNARVKAMLEDAATIQKSLKMISELHGKSSLQSQQQFVRWVITKETHSQNIISTISDYFLTQRVNPTQSDYGERLKKHHGVIISAMKTKQNTDMKHLKTLTKNIKELLPYYPEHKHQK